jgi:hypothetical protein
MPSIREPLFEDLACDMAYSEVFHDLHQSHQGHTCTIPQSGHDHFLTQSFNSSFISPRHSTAGGLPWMAEESGFVGFEVFTAVAMRNVVIWDIKTQFVLHRRHITSPLHSPAS